MATARLPKAIDHVVVALDDTVEDKRRPAFHRLAV